MSSLKALLRWSFALTAMFLLSASLVVLVQLMHPGGVASPLFSHVGCAGFLACGLLFAAACWTTRKPGIVRNPWALSASLVQIVSGILILRHIRHITIANPEAVLIASGVLGLLVFSRDRTPSSAPAIAPAKPAPIPGDRTSPSLDRLSSILFTIATWVVMTGWYPWAAAHHLHPSSGLPLFLLIAIVAVVTAVLHECGHALAAHAFRMDLLGFNAGPFQWRKQQGSWRLQFKTSGILGGSVHVLPTHPDQPLWQELVMVAAGPLVNLCTGPVFLWLALHAQGAPWQPAWFLFAFMASFAFLVAAFNLFPFRSATGSYSDGARILQLLTHSPAVELQRAMRRTQATSAPELAGA